MTKAQEAMMRRVFAAGEQGLHVPDPTAGERKTLNWLTRTGWLKREISRYQPSADADRYLRGKLAALCAALPQEGE